MYSPRPIIFGGASISSKTYSINKSTQGKVCAHRLEKSPILCSPEREEDVKTSLGLYQKIGQNTQHIITSAETTHESTYDANILTLREEFIPYVAPDRTKDTVLSSSVKLVTKKNFFGEIQHTIPSALLLSISKFPYIVRIIPTKETI